MSLTQTPAPARSDVSTGATTTTSDHESSSHPYRFHGTVLTAGAVAWSIAIALFGADPGDKTVPLVGFAIGSGFFQLGVMALLRVLWRPVPRPWSSAWRSARPPSTPCACRT